MAFLVKQDYFGLANETLVIKSSTEGASASTATAKGSDGSIVAVEVFGKTAAPSCDYAIKGDVTLSSIKLGGVTTVNSKSYALGSVSINTSAGGEPTVSASGEQVEDNSTPTCVYPVSDEVKLTTRHHAQILFGAFTLGGTGCHLQSANYTMSASVGRATVNGNCVAHDVAEGKIECAVTIQQVGADAPTLTPGDGWTITSPLTLSNPDSDWGSWSGTLTKFLAKS